MSKSIIIKMINLFLVAGAKHLMVTHLINNLNAWILFWKTWIATENCCYKKLLKEKLTTSKDVPSLLFLQRYVQPQSICTEHVKFSKVMSLLPSSRWCTIYFFELYISDLTVIIPSMFCTGAVETGKSCIGLSLLLANLYFQVVNFLVERRLFLQLRSSNLPVAKFLTAS